MSHSYLDMGNYAPIHRQRKAEMSSKDVLELYDTLERLGVHIWVDGGWGVDALLGSQTRVHKDLDIVIQERDVPMLRQVTRSKGFKEIKLEIAKPHNFVLGDPDGREIDVHVIVFDENGNGIYGPPEGGLMYPAASLVGSGSIDDRIVRCISAEWVVRFHTGYELTEKDVRDVTAICQRFGIELPNEYRQKEFDN